MNYDLRRLRVISEKLMDPGMITFGQELSPDVAYQAMFLVFEIKIS